MSQRYNLRARTTTPVYNPLKKESDTFIIKKKKKQISTSKLHPYESHGPISYLEIIKESFEKPYHIGIELKHYLQTFRKILIEDSVLTNTRIDNLIEQIDNRLEEFGNINNIMEEYSGTRMNGIITSRPTIFDLGEDIVMSLYHRTTKIIKEMYTHSFVINQNIDSNVESYLDLRQKILTMEGYMILHSKYLYITTKDNEIIKRLLKNLEQMGEQKQKLNMKYKRLKIRESDIKNVKILHNTVLPTDVCNYVIKNFL